MVSKEFKLSYATSEDKLRAYLYLTKGISHNLSKREISIAVALIPYADKEGNLSYILNDYDQRINIQDKIGITQGTFTTSLFRMRAKQFIIGNFISLDLVMVSNTENPTISFDFYKK